MAKRTKIIKVKGHYRKVVVGEVVKVDPDNPAHEVYQIHHRNIYVKGYDKIVKYDDGS